MGLHVTRINKNLVRVTHSLKLLRYQVILPEIEEILPWALMPNHLVQMLY